MAACANHALWIETLRRFDRISRQHQSSIPQLMHAECLRKQLQEPSKRNLIVRGLVTQKQPSQQLQHSHKCKNCNWNLSVTTYKCSCSLANSLCMEPLMRGARGDNNFDAYNKTYCPFPGYSDKCLPTCSCGCQRNGCCKQLKLVNRMKERKICNCSCKIPNCNCQYK